MNELMQQIAAAERGGGVNIRSKQDPEIVRQEYCKSIAISRCVLHAKRGSDIHRRHRDDFRAILYWRIIGFLGNEGQEIGQAGTITAAVWRAGSCLLRLREGQEHRHYQQQYEALGRSHGARSDGIGMPIQSGRLSTTGRYTPVARAVTGAPISVISTLQIGVCRHLPASCGRIRGRGSVAGQAAAEILTLLLSGILFSCPFAAWGYQDDHDRETVSHPSWRPWRMVFDIRQADELQAQESGCPACHPCHAGGAGTAARRNRNHAVGVCRRGRCAQQPAPDAP